MDKRSFTSIFTNLQLISRSSVPVKLPLLPFNCEVTFGKRQPKVTENCFLFKLCENLEFEQDHTVHSPTIH